VEKYDAHEQAKRGMADGERSENKYVHATKKRKMQHDSTTRTYPKLFTPPDVGLLPKISSKTSIDS
tara:strand:- start:175 stop:372 length:198 start_codon:yes stop_codon:yes gene_type:complete